MLGFISDKRIENIVREAIACLPKGSRAYLVGGTMRNAVYFKIHGEHLPQRDFDIAYTTPDFGRFKKNLVREGFVSAGLERDDHFVLKKRIGWDEKNDLENFVFVEVSKAPSHFRKRMLKADFTVGGFSIPFRKVLNDDWFRWVSALPSSLDDIRRKRLRLNSPRERSVFRAIRFVSIGFSPPNKEEIGRMVEAMRTIESDVLKRNVEKLQRLVPAANIRKIARMMGVSKIVENAIRGRSDIFS